MTGRRAIEASGCAPALGPYSHAIAHGGLLYCSGALPLDREGELVGSTPAEQTRRCLSNLEQVAAAGGTTLEQALRLTIFTTRLDEFPSINEAYAETFQAEPPARVTVGVEQLPRGALVEIDAIVALADAADRS